MVSLKESKSLIKTPVATRQLDSEIVEKFLKLSPETKCELFYNFDSFVYISGETYKNDLATYLVALEIAGNPFPLMLSRKSRAIAGIASEKRIDRYVSITSNASTDFNLATTKYFNSSVSLNTDSPLAHNCIPYLLRAAYGERELIEIMDALAKSHQFVSMQDIILLREQWSELKEHPIEWSIHTLPDFFTYDFKILKPSEMFDPIK